MKTIKFVCVDERERQFAAAVRKNVYEYFKEKGISQKGNFLLAIQSIAMLAIYIGPFIIIITTPLNPWVAMLLAILMGVGMAGVGMCIMHDGVHGAYSKKEWVNNVAGGTMFLLGSTVVNWRIQTQCTPSYLYQY